MSHQPQPQPPSSPSSSHEQKLGAASPIEQELSVDQQEINTILRNIRHAPDGMGILALGRDGVYRSLTADREVVDAVPLPPRLIKALLDRHPFDQQLENVFCGVDGTHVARERCFNPDRALLPEPLSEEQKREAQEFYEQNRETIEINMESARKGEHTGCGCTPRVISNYNLVPKTAGVIPSGDETVV